MTEEAHTAGMPETFQEELRQAVREVFRQEMGAYMERVFKGHFYENLVMEMKGGIGDVYHTITDFKKALGSLNRHADSAETLIGDASDQLEEIVKTTESATIEIMDITERHQQKLAEISGLLEKLPPGPELPAIRQMIETMNSETMSIMTACSFQDITGQRVRKVVELIRRIEQQILEMMVSSGIKLKEKQEGKSDYQIESDASRAVEQLKGPDSSVNQENVDDLLAQLGL